MIIPLNVLVFLNVDASRNETGLNVYRHGDTATLVVFGDVDERFVSHLSSLSVL
tara:strand:+ start:2625 stop:2786 length:162 start_codon:yes stop_codon:yes gene_type:complete